MLQVNPSFEERLGQLRNQCCSGPPAHWQTEHADRCALTSESPDQQRSPMTLPSTTAENLERISPKQPSHKRHRDWYPYYAGFTENFVAGVIGKYLQNSTLVLDPWSGSGTTVATCIHHGINAEGIDINPALTVIARARLNPQSSREGLNDLAKKVIDVSQEIESRPSRSDLLARWVNSSGAGRIRAMQQAIHEVLGEEMLSAGEEGPNVDDLSAEASYFYTALFGVVRALLNRYVATNPMWLKYPQTYRHRIRPSSNTLQTEFRRQVNYLANRLSPESGQMSSTSPFRTGTATHLPFADDAFDGAVTSPPYATRVDYIRGTLPELAVLGVGDQYIAQLRSAITGALTVRGTSLPLSTDLASPYAIDMLEAIGSHSSKGSKAYYLPWMSNYLHSLQVGLQELNRTVRSNCPICIVVQDSYYKEIQISMQRIVVEMLCSFGRRMSGRHDYAAPNPRRMSSIQAAVEAETASNAETLLVFS